MPILTPEEFAKLTGQSTESVQPQSIDDGSKVMSAEQFAAQFGDGETLPRYANGNSPETAINISPVSVEERAKLALGNDAGRLKYLKSAYGEVRRARNGDLVVNDGTTGLWHRVDPNGLGDGDPIEKTRELIADATDIAPIAIKTAMQMGATALATSAGLVTAAPTAGASLVGAAAFSGAVGAALAAGETSLGRLVGTYDATPEEQLRDIAIESVLNFGGTYFTPGIKMHAGQIAEGVKKGAKALGSGVGNVTKSVLAAASGAGEKNMNTLIDNADEVSGIIKKKLTEFGDPTKAIESMIQENLDDVENIARAVRPTTTAAMGKIDSEIVKYVDDSFIPGFKGMYDDAAKLLEGMKLGTIDKVGKFIPHTKDQLEELAKTEGHISRLLFDDDSMKIVSDAVKELNILPGIKEASGKAGASQLLTFRRGLLDLTMKLQNKAKEGSLGPAQAVLSQLKNVVEKNVSAKFELGKEVTSSVLGTKSTNLYRTANEWYSSHMTEMSPLIKAVYQADVAKNPNAFQTLYTQISSRAGKSVRQKSSFDNAIDFMKRTAGVEGAEMAGRYKRINLTESAAAFTPGVKQSLISQGSIMGMITGVMFGNVAGLASAVGALAATSPKFIKNLVTGALKSKAFLSKLPPDQLKQFTSNPQLTDKWAKTFINSPLLVEGTKQSLFEAAQRQTGGR